MGISGKHCELCGRPWEPTVGCTKPNCVNNRAYAELLKNAPPVDVEVDLGIDTEIPPPTGGDRPSVPSDIPTGDPPPLTQALTEYLSMPQADRKDNWPDHGSCSNRSCKRELDPDHLFCPHCGRRRELPTSVRRKADLYGAAMTRNSIGSSKPPSETNLPAVGHPLQPPRSAMRPAGEARTTYSFVARQEEEKPFPDPTKKPQR